MLIGYARVSKSDNSQVLDLQIDALTNSGVKEENIYSDKISGSKDERPGLENWPPLHKGTKCDMRFKSSLNSARLNLLNPYK